MWAMRDRFVYRFFGGFDDWSVFKAEMRYIRQRVMVVIYISSVLS